MDYILIKYIAMGISTVIIMFYVNIYIHHELSSGKTYNDLMTLLIKHKEIFEYDNFYTSLEKDFALRRLPTIEYVELIDRAKHHKISSEDKNRIRHLDERLRTQLYVFSPEEIHSRRIRRYTKIKISKQIHTALLLILATSLITYITTNHLAKAQTLEKYREKGIESLDERYISKNETITDNVKIIDREYKSGFFGAQYYTFEIQISTPINQAKILDIDPVLYQNKKIGDTLKVEIIYQADIDRYENTEKFSIEDIRILE